MEIQNNRLTIALPKGRLADISLDIMRKTSILNISIPEKTRKLIFYNDNTRILLIKPSDVPTYVEFGIADIGIAGKDVLIEQNKDLFEPLDLKFGYCYLAIAAREQEFDYKRNFIRVATKYPNTARNFFNTKGSDIEIIKLYGSVEIAPVVGLSDCIVDIVSSGETLKENGLKVVEKIMDSTARLIVNKAALKIKQKQIKDIIRLLKNYVENN